MYSVYKITNKVNNKKYIGITSKTISERFRQHYNDAINSKDNYPFHCAIRKYGIDMFYVELLETNLTEDQAKERERYYIKYYNTFIKNNYGYNATYGGDLNDCRFGEDNPVSKLTQADIDKIYDMLLNSMVPMSRIPELLNLPICGGYIDDINKGLCWNNANLSYPLRKDAKTISKIGDNNPSAKLSEEDVLSIIDDLLNTKIPQTQLAKKYGVSYNTINGINRCKN